MNRSTGNARFSIRRMKSDDLATAIEWAAGEGWNPGVNDAACFYRADPDGFFVAELDGEPIGAISAVGYGENFGFVGLYIVRPDQRGHAYGAALACAARRHLRGCNIGVDGVLERVASYEGVGFKRAYSNARFVGQGSEGGSGSGIVDMSSLDWGEILSYDRLCFPAPREEFLWAWIDQPGAAALGACGRGGLQGYGVLRPCRSGFKIGPLFADDAEIAERLFQALCGRAGAGSQVYLDIPEVNPEALKLAERHGMKKVFATARMYSDAPPQIELRRVFGITSFELG